MRILLPRVDIQEDRLSFYTNFHLGLVDAVREMGHEPVTFSVAKINAVDTGEAHALMRLLTTQACDLVLDVCCWTTALSNIKFKNNAGEAQPVFDMFSIGYVGMLYDQPWNQALAATASARLFASVPDRHFVDSIACLEPQLSLGGVAFAPPATRSGNDLSVPWSERSIDVLYVGTMDSRFLSRIWRQFPDPEPLDAAADQILSHPDKSWLSAALGALGAAGIEPQPWVIKELLLRVDLFIRMRYRYDAVRAIAASGVTVHVVGGGWANLDLPSNVVLHLPVDYKGMLALAGRSRICLDSSIYPTGASDRIFNYAINRAVCFTNAVEYPQASFRDNEGLHYYSMLNLEELGDSVRSALARPERLRTEGEQASHIAVSRHSWLQRLENILEMTHPAANGPAGAIGPNPAYDSRGCDT